MMEGRIMGIGPPARPKPVEYTQEEYYCERCAHSFEEETIYNMIVGLYVCSKCEKDVRKHEES